MLRVSQHREKENRRTKSKRKTRGYKIYIFAEGVKKKESSTAQSTRLPGKKREKKEKGEQVKGRAEGGEKVGETQLKGRGEWFQTRKPTLTYPLGAEGEGRGTCAW